MAQWHKLRQAWTCRRAGPDLSLKLSIMKQYVSKSIHGKHIQEGLHMGQESIYRKAYISFLLVTSQQALVWKLWPIILDMRLWKLYIFILPIKAIAYLSDYLFFSRVKQLSCIKLILMFLKSRIQAWNACAIHVDLFNLCNEIWLPCVFSHSTIS